MTRLFFAAVPFPNIRRVGAEYLALERAGNGDSLIGGHRTILLPSPCVGILECAAFVSYSIHACILTWEFRGEKPETSLSRSLLLLDTLALTDSG